MSLNKIKLNNNLLVSLYENVLVERPSNTAALRFLGENKRGIAILVSYPDLPVLPDESLQFLTTVLAACKLNLSDVAILNTARYPTTAAVLSDQLAATTIISFDLEPAALSLPLNFPHYQVQSYNNCTYLHAPALEIVQHNKTEKQQLWASLQKLFAL